MSEAFVNGLWRASWQGSLVLAALWIFCRVFESRRWLSADVRCWLWRLGYIRLLFGLASAAAIALPLLPAGREIANEAQPSALYQNADVRANVPISAPLVLPQTERTAKLNTPAVSAAPTVTWQTVLVVAYFLGGGVCVFRVGQKGFATRRLLKVSAPDAETTEEIARLAPLFGLRRVPRAVRSASVSVPSYSAGVVLLPAGANYAPDELRLILAHELSHARRRDLAWEWLATAAHIVFFFHPLVWAARREEAVCREEAADAMALRLTNGSASGYGKLLLGMSLISALPASQTPLLGVIGIVHRGAISRRLHYLQEDFSMVCQAKHRVATAALILSVSALVLVPWSLTNKAAQAQQKAALPPPTSAEKLAYTQALSKAKQLGIACLMKEQDEGRVFKINPSTFRQDINPYVRTRDAFTSPLDKPGTQSFVFNKALSNAPETSLKNTQDIVMVYEGAWRKPLFRYNGAALIVFADGHVQAVTPAQAKTLVWSLTNQAAQKQKTPLQAVGKAAEAREKANRSVLGISDYTPQIAAPTATQELLPQPYQKALDNAKQLGLACVMKAADENKVFKISPSTFRKDVSLYLMNKNAFTSPLDKPGTQSFQFNKALQNVRQKQLKNAQNVVMAYEGTWGKPSFRYNGFAIIVFAEGHAKAVTPAQAKTLIWEPQTQGTRTQAQKTKQAKQTQAIAGGYEAQKESQIKAAAALDSGDTKEATRLAQLMLQNNADPHDWNYGNIIHNAHQILGLAALQEGRTSDAKAFLLTAGKTPGSPQLDSFGPSMVLAQKLLGKGEKQTVIEYLDLVEKFWGHTSDAQMARLEKQSPDIAASSRQLDLRHQQQIADWKAQIAAGQKPTLNMSGFLPYVPLPLRNPSAASLFIEGIFK